MWWLGALELVGFNDSWWHELLGFSVNPCNTLKNHHVWSFASKLCTYRASSGHLGKATASGYVDHSGLLISVMIEEHPAEDQWGPACHVYIQVNSYWDTLSHFESGILNILNTLASASRTQSCRLCGFFFIASLSQIRLILESCLICVASVVGNTLKSSKTHDPPSFSQHFPIIFQHLPYANGIISLSVCRFSGFRLARRKACGIPSANVGISTGHL